MTEEQLVDIMEHLHNFLNNQDTMPTIKTFANISAFNINSYMV